MKLYTRSGDDGSTGLFGGGRVDKDHARIEAYGTVDELNAAIGLALGTQTLREGCEITRHAKRGETPDDGLARLADILFQIQSLLFDLGADLATPEDSKHADRITRIAPAAVSRSESWIDEVDGGNEPMKSFILPGGTEFAARLHLARTVCRRAERRVITLGRVEPINPNVVVFLNRLSDLLFAMARAANRAAGVADVPWTPQVKED